MVANDSTQTIASPAGAKGPVPRSLETIMALIRSDADGLTRQEMSIAYQAATRGSEELRLIAKKWMSICTDPNEKKVLRQLTESDQDAKKEATHARRKRFMEMFK